MLELSLALFWSFMAWLSLNRGDHTHAALAALMSLTMAALWLRDRRVREYPLPDDDDEALLAVARKTWETGKPHTATRHEDGTLEIKEAGDG